MASEVVPVLGVVIVTYQSEDVIAECLETLAGSTGVSLKVVVVDNASHDGTCDVIAAWASGAAPFVQPQNSPLPPTQPTPKPIVLDIRELDEASGNLGPFTLIRTAVNQGFAGGVNAGLKALEGQADWFWVLNPDCAVPPATAHAYVAAATADPAGTEPG